MMPKLLLADDSITVQRVIALTFQGEGIEVIAVGDGDLAVDAIDRERPQIVLADLSMPGRDGYAVAEYVKRSPELSKDIRVVLLTGAAEPVEEARSRALGIDGVLSKPFEPHVATALVRRLLTRDAHRPRLPRGGVGGVADAPAADTLKPPLRRRPCPAGRRRPPADRRRQRQRHRRRRLLPPPRRGARHRRPVDGAGTGWRSRRHRRSARPRRGSLGGRRDDDRAAPRARRGRCRPAAADEPASPSWSTRSRRCSPRKRATAARWSRARWRWRARRRRCRRRPSSGRRVRRRPRRSRPPPKPWPSRPWPRTPPKRPPR